MKIGKPRRVIEIPDPEPVAVPERDPEPAKTPEPAAP